MERKNKWFWGFGTSLASLVLGLLMPVFATTVFAGEAESPLDYFTVGSYDYSDYSGVNAGVSNGIPYADSWSRVQTSDLITTVPAGYMGAEGRLFNDSDQLVVQTGFTYNSTQTSTWNSDFAYLNPAVSGTGYYGYGIAAAYNGNGYDTYYTYKSPIQNAS